MQNVYFKKITDYSDKQTINDFCFETLNKIIQSEGIELAKTVPLKVHFGEDESNTYIIPDNFLGVRRFLETLDKQSCYMDSNVLYKSRRSKEDTHKQLAMEHGFTDLEVIIADGDEDNPYTEVEINKKHFDKCRISTKYADYDNFIVLAHFKGHGLAGMGASIKQLAMGFAARGGKLHQHSESVPIISSGACVACGACISCCPVNAISVNDVAIIDESKCIGCAKCTLKCPVNAINNSWDSANFLEKLAEYAYAAQLNKKNIYINFAMNITEQCDCFDEKLPIIAPNIGIFISTDAVANDKATMDKYQELTGNHNFDKVYKTLDYAEEVGLGSNSYNLIEED